VKAAWKPIAALVTNGDTEKGLLLAAIEAAAAIRPEEAAELLDELSESEDEDITGAAQEALAMARHGYGDDEDEWEDDEDEDQDDEGAGKGKGKK
jgi:hypothetical protein